MDELEMKKGGRERDEKGTEMKKGIHKCTHTHSPTHTNKHNQTHTHTHTHTQWGACLAVIAVVTGYLDAASPPLVCAHLFAYFWCVSVCVFVCVCVCVVCVPGTRQKDSATEQKQ